MTRHKNTAADRVARERLSALRKGEATEAMSTEYRLSKNGKQIVRKKPKEHLSKKERRRKRGTDGESMRATEQGR